MIGVPFLLYLLWFLQEIFRRMSLLRRGLCLLLGCYPNPNPLWGSVVNSSTRIWIVCLSLRPILETDVRLCKSFSANRTYLPSFMICLNRSIYQLSELLSSLLCFELSDWASFQCCFPGSLASILSAPFVLSGTRSLCDISTFCAFSNLDLIRLNAKPLRGRCSRIVANWLSCLSRHVVAWAGRNRVGFQAQDDFGASVSFWRSSVAP